MNPLVMWSVPFLRLSQEISPLVLRKTQSLPHVSFLARVQVEGGVRTLFSPSLFPPVSGDVCCLLYFLRSFSLLLTSPELLRGGFSLSLHFFPFLPSLFLHHIAPRRSDSVGPSVLSQQGDDRSLIVTFVTRRHSLLFHPFFLYLNAKSLIHSCMVRISLFSATSS